MKDNIFPNFERMNEKTYFLVARMYNRYVDLLERIHDGRESQTTKKDTYTITLILKSYN